MSKFCFRNCWMTFLRGKIEFSHVYSLFLPWFMHSGMSLGILFSQFQKMALILEDGKICSAYVELHWSSFWCMIQWVPWRTLSPDGCRFESLRLSCVGFNSGTQNYLPQALVLCMFFHRQMGGTFWVLVHSTVFRLLLCISSMVGGHLFPLSSFRVWATFFTALIL